MLLQLVDVVREFGGLRAVDHLSLDVAAGEMVGLVGPNGSGKTTTLHLIAGLLQPSAGSIWFDGRRIDGRPPEYLARAGIGRTFQVTRVFARMTVEENLRAAALACGRVPRGELPVRIEETLDLLRLVPLARRPAGQLSGGQQRLLELGRALMTAPRLLLLDEPFAGVHPELRAQLRHHIRHVNAAGTACVLVDHDLDSVFQLSHRLVVMRAGSKLVEGAPEAVRADERVVDAYLAAG